LRLATAPLPRKRCEILLASLQRLRLLIGSALKIHAEPKNRDEYPGDASRNVLRSFQALVACELLDLRVVAGHLGHDSGAVQELILGLNNRNRRWRPTRTASQRDAKRHDS
jgi:hypothetical protein